jgi:hypothetical protein
MAVVDCVYTNKKILPTVGYITGCRALVWCRCTGEEHNHYCRSHGVGIGELCWAHEKYGFMSDWPQSSHSSGGEKP